MNTRTNCDTILLIEDNLGDARLVREAFAEVGVKVDLHHCVSLQEGRQYLTNNVVDLILLDLDLPDAAGLEGLWEVSRTAPRTPIVMVTGNDDESYALRALRRGAQDHLVKGQFDGNALLRSVRYARERQRTVNLRSDLLAAVAQEIKAPVDVLRNSLCPLLESETSGLTPRQYEMLQRACNAAGGLGRFHETMRDLASEEDGPMRYGIAGLNATHVVEEIKRRVERNGEAAQIEVGSTAQALGKQSDSMPSSGDAPIRLLLVEDNAGDARLIAELLKEIGFATELTHSTSLSDGAQRLTRETYDVALIDLGLPDASGLEAVSEAKRLAPRTPIIVITGRDDDAVAAEALRKGAQDYLVKGRVGADVLRRSIRFARERQRAVNMRSELLESIAFELRHPIHVVLGYVHLLLETIPDPLQEDQVRNLYIVLEQARTLRWLTDAMLDVAGAERGPLRYELSQAGVPEIIEALKCNVAAHSAAAPEVRRSERVGRSMTMTEPAKPGRLFRGALRRLGLRKQVLIVDPDYDSRTIIRTVLEGGRYDVVEAERGSDILEHLGRSSIELAIVGPQTPAAAAGALDEVRRIATSHKVPMVWVDRGDVNGHAEQQRDYRISKPFTPEQILFAVDHVLGRA
jgi:DNA-binding response OmpR family regulator